MDKFYEKFNKNITETYSTIKTILRFFNSLSI